MAHRLFHSLLVLTILLAGTLPATPILRAQPQPLSLRTASTPAADAPLAPEQTSGPEATSAGPLPGNCPGSTDPDAPTPCCISGLVYVNGMPVRDAIVEIQSERGISLPSKTNNVEGGGGRPYYHAKVSNDLAVTVGETITLTTRYTDTATTQLLTKQIVYKIKPGPQQVDFVLYSSAAGDYILDRTIWQAAELGQLDNSQDVAVDSAGNIYVADSGSHRIQVFDPKGSLLHHWGTLGSEPGQFTNPTSLTIGPDGPNRRVYVLDAGNYRVQVFKLDGEFVSVWGSKGSGPGQFQSPYAIEVDAQNRVYVADGYRIQRFSDSGEWQRSWGESGEGNGQFHSLQTIALAREQSLLYTLETYWVGEAPDVRRAGRIQSFDLDGNWRATWTDRVGGGGGDWDVENIVTDSQGSLYAADNTGIHRLTANGATERSWSIDGPLYHNFAVDTDVDTDADFYLTSYSGKIDVFAISGQQLESIGSSRTPNGHLFGGPAEAMDVNDDGILAVVQNSGDAIGNVHLFNVRSGAWITTSYGSRSFVSPGDVVIRNEEIYVLETFSKTQFEHYTINGEWKATYLTGSYDGDRIAIDSAGRILVAANFRNTIQIIDPSSAPPSLSSLSLQTAAANIGRITGFVIDQENRLYVAEDRCDCVGRFTLDGKAINDFGSFIQNVSASPFGAVQVDNAGIIYVKESKGFAKYNNTGNLLGRIPISGSVGGDDSIYQIDEWNRILIYRYTGKPIATINHLSSIAGQLTISDTLTLTGVGQDSDATDDIRGYEWSSDRDGLLGESPVLTLTHKAVSSGIHTLNFRVQDDELVWSAPVTWTLEVLNDGPPPTVAWGMLLYLAGDQSEQYDDTRLLARFLATMGRLEKSFRNSDVRIAVQIDGPRRNDSQRLLITPGNAPLPATIETIAIGEQAMDNPNTLSEFVVWAQGQIPAEHYYLAIADHGQAVQGIAWDKTSDLADNGIIDNSARLIVKDLAQALGDQRLRAIDILHLDACSMNLLETAYELKDAAKFLISSQYLAWDYFAYDLYAPLLTATRPSADAAQAIMQTYAQKVYTDTNPYTLSVLDLDRIDDVKSALDGLTDHLSGLYDGGQITKPLIQEILTGVQRFDTNGDTLNTDQDIYVDLLDWTRRVSNTLAIPSVTTYVNALQTELTGDVPFIFSNAHTTETLPSWAVWGDFVDVTRASGLSIVYPHAPQGALFTAYKKGEIFSFVNDSHWDEFLEKMPGTLGGSPGDEIPGPVAPLPSEIPSRIFLPLVQTQAVIERAAERPVSDDNPSSAEKTALRQLFLPSVTR